MIHLLWPTIRPKMMVDTYVSWMNRASDQQRIKTYVAVNTKPHQYNLRHLLNQRSLLTNIDIFVSGDVVGVSHACNFLTHLPQLEGPNSDLVILSSDDMYAPPNWDSWLISEFNNESLLAILVNDGYISQQNITIPILTMGCLKRLNRIIYHPSYKHSYSDTELYDNLNKLNLLRNLWSKSPVFEHRNWANSKRNFDHIDKTIRDLVENDAHNWQQRCQLSIEERLK